MAHVNKIKRNIQYTNKDFAELRAALIAYSKNYFPNTYRDFNEASPAMHMLELAAVVGDINNFYADVQLQESFLQTVDERINLYNLAQGMGYKAKTVVPASVMLEIYQLVPSIGSGVNTRPDYRYGLIVENNMTCQTDDGIKFHTIDAVDFRFSSSFDPTETSVYSVTDDGSIEYYLLKKNVRAVSGEIRTAEYSFGEPKRYDKIVLPDENVTEIIDMVDNDGNTWHEVHFMAQDLVPITVKNTPYHSPAYYKYRSSTPYILAYKQVERRFITRLRKDELTEIQFGAGLSVEADEEIVPNPYNVAIGLDYISRTIDASIDPMNFLYTHTYGTAPSNTVITVRYAVSNGLIDNVNANTITTIISSEIVNPIDTVDSSVLTTIRNSLAITNPDPAFGGQDRKEIDVIREEAIANFAAQNRAVTKEDYILRCFTMPAKFGAIAKAYVEQDQQLSRWNEYEKLPNPYALNLYVLSYDREKHLVPCNTLIQENLRNYLSQYRLMTDAINIKTPFVVNIGVNFEIIVRPEYNSNEVLLKCVEKVIEMFHPDKMEINQPILISKIYTEIDKVEGVQTVQKVEIVNLFDKNQGYSGYVYDINNSIKEGILYPSLDPSVFEIRYPKRDIKGRVNDI